MSKKLAIIIPVLNEATIIANSLEEIARHLVPLDAFDFTIIVVNDGSTDETVELVSSLGSELTEAKLQLISLSRNFGKESAISAGLAASKEFDAAIVMDSDLQHPPALIPQMLDHWQQGSLVVEGVKRSRGEESQLRGLSAKLYYRLFHLFTGLDISADTDFKLLDREVIARYCALPESNRFFRGLIKWMGVAATQLPFEVPSTRKKSSSWRGFSLFRYAITTISSFTSYPLQIVTLLGAVTFLLSVVFGGIALYDKLTGNAVDGFTTVILLILIIGSVLMFSLGLIGIYLGKIFDEVKSRPNYVLDLETEQKNKKDS